MMLNMPCSKYRQTGGESGDGVQRFNAGTHWISRELLNINTATKSRVRNWLRSETLTFYIHLFSIDLLYKRYFVIYEAMNKI